MQELIKKLGEQSDQIAPGRSLYDVGWSELIAKNFIAGISRAFGGLVFNLLALIIIGSILVKTIWPQAQGFLDSLMNVSQTITQFEQNLVKLNNFPVNLK